MKKPEWEEKQVNYSGMVEFLKQAREVLQKERDRVASELKERENEKDVETTD